MVASTAPPPEHRGAERGYALLLSLVVLLVVSAALALMAGTLALQMNVLQDELQRMRLIAMTDAGLAETLATLSHQPSFAGVPERTFAGGAIWSRVERHDSRRATIEVSARLGGRVRTVQADTERTQGRLTIESWRHVPGGGS